MIDIESEFASMVADTPSLTFFVEEGFSAELLMSADVKAIYVFAKEHLFATGVAPSMQILQHEFPNFSFKEELDSTPYYVMDSLRKRFKQLKVKGALREAAQHIDDPDQALKSLRDSLREIDRSVPTSSVYSAGDFRQQIEKYVARVAQYRDKGATTGFREIDEHMGGFKPGQLIFYVARPKRMKTFLMLHAFVKQIKENNKRPIFFTLEMTVEEIWLRLLALITGFSYSSLERGHFTLDIKEFLYNKMQDFESRHEFWITRPESTDIGSLILEADRRGADVVFIDQLKYIRGNGRKYDVWWQEAQDVVHDLKIWATKCDIPIICAAQMTRDASKISDLSEAEDKIGLTRAIEETADFVFGLHRTKEMQESSEIQMGILYARSSDLGEWQIHHDLVSRTEFRVV